MVVVVVLTLHPLRFQLTSLFKSCIFWSFQGSSLAGPAFWISAAGLGLINGGAGGASISLSQASSNNLERRACKATALESPENATLK